MLTAIDDAHQALDPFGRLRAHIWQGQGWQNQYHWLPDNDDVHIAARYEVSINLPKGIIVDWDTRVNPRLYKVPSTRFTQKFQRKSGSLCCKLS